MRKIPRKIDNLKGFVIVKGLGHLPYETEDDLEELEIFGKLFLDAVEKGRLVLSPSILPQLNNSSKGYDHKMLSKLMNHQLKNLNLLSAKEIDMLDTLRKKNKKDILILKGRALKKILPRLFN